MEETEIEDPEQAVERFAELMILEKIDPIDIAYLVDKLIKRMRKNA